MPLVVVCAFAAAPRVSAQEGNRFALGANFTMRAPNSTLTHAAKGPGIAWRFGHDQTGWGWHYGLGWYSLDVDRRIGGRTTDLGEIRIRPLMAGYGYTHVLGRVAVTTDVLGGYSFATFGLSTAAREAYLTRLGAQSVDADVTGSPVVKPEVGMWLDMTRKMGINVNAAYIIARPRMTISSALGSDVQRLNADALVITFGAVYRIR